MELAQDIAASIREEGGSAEAVAFDVADAAATGTALAALLARAPIQILVNNAGVDRRRAAGGHVATRSGTA